MACRSGGKAGAKADCRPAVGEPSPNSTFSSRSKLIGPAELVQASGSGRLRASSGGPLPICRPFSRRTTQPAARRTSVWAWVTNNVGISHWATAR